MVFRRGLSVNKSSQVSRTLLSILADLCNALVWIVSPRPLISKSSSPFTNLLVTVPRAPITTGITVTFKFQIFSLISQQRPSTYTSLRFLSILHCGQPCQPSPQFSKSQKSFTHLILQDRCWVVHKPFVRMVKFQFLTQFPMDHLAHPVVSSLILFCVNLQHSFIM